MTRDIKEYTLDELVKKKETWIAVHQSLEMEDVRPESIEDAERHTKELLNRLGRVDVIGEVREALRLVRTILLEYPGEETRKYDIEVFDFMQRTEQFFEDFKASKESTED